jgi:RNA polymerase sigma-70 factor (ECF subfamily)
VLGRKLIQQANRAKGRFRTFLLIALERYLKSIYRKKTAKKRIPEGRMIQLAELDPTELPEPVQGLDATESFNYTWVSALLDKLLEEVEAECRANDMKVHWELFQARVLQPIMENTDSSSLAEICDTYGIEDAAKASNMIFSVKRRFQAALKRHLRQSVTAESEINEELRELMQFFARKSAR